jgi:hypothetical protein
MLVGAQSRALEINMSKIEKIDRNTCKNLRESLNRALELFAKSRGLEIKATNASYADHQVTFKLVCTLDSVDPDKIEFDRVCGLYHLKPEQYGKTITFNRKDYRLIGIVPRRPKYPVLAERDGKRYKLPGRALMGVVADADRSDLAMMLGGA